MKSQYMTCSCSAMQDNNNDNIVKKEKFNAKKIYESFYDVLKYSNYDILKCYKIISNIKTINTNIGNTMTILFFICYFICIIDLIFRGIKPLKIKLRNEMNQIKNKNKLVIKSNYHNLFKNTDKRLRKKKLSLLKIKKKYKMKKNRADLNNQSILSNSLKSNIKIKYSFRKLKKKQKLIKRKNTQIMN